MDGITDDERLIINALENEEITAEIEQELKKYHINLKNNEYWKEKNYEYFLTKFIRHKENPIFNSITYDYYIYKIILPKKGIDVSRFLGDFDMGSHKKAPGRIQVGKLIDEIEETVIFPLNPEIGKNGEDLYHNIYKKIYGSSSKAGLLKQFEEILDIDFSAVDDYSKYKFIKLMYKFCKTNYYGKKINFIQMFKKASYVNSNRFFEGNAKYIELLKNELIKEIPLDIYYRLITNIDDVNREWMSIYKYAQDLLFEKKYTTLEFFADHLEQRLKEIVYFENNKEQVNDEESIFVKVFFWVLQYQNRCYSEEVISISNQILDHYISYRNGHVTENRPIKFPLEDYIQKHTTEFLDILVTDEFSEKEAIDLLQNSPKYIKTFIEMMNKNQMFQQTDGDVLIKSVPFSFLLASLFALRDVIVNNEKGKNSFYHASKSGQMKLISKINSRENNEDRFYQIYWVKKISIIEMTILHSEAASKSKIKIDNDIHRTMSYLYSIHNMADFEVTNERLLTVVRQIICCC